MTCMTYEGFTTFWWNQMSVTQTTTWVTSSSILFLSPVALGPPAPGLFCRQSLAICPAPPQLEHTMLFVTFGLSGHCNNQVRFWWSEIQLFHSNSTVNTFNSIPSMIYGPMHHSLNTVVLHFLSKFRSAKPTPLAASVASHSGLQELQHLDE